MEFLEEACVPVVAVVSFCQLLCWPCGSDASPLMHCCLHDAKNRQSGQPLLPENHNVELFFSDGAPSGHVFLCQPLLWRPFRRRIMHQFQSRLGTLDALICIHLRTQVGVQSFILVYGSMRFQPLLGLGLAGCCYNQTIACLNVTLSVPIGCLC